MSRCSKRLAAWLLSAMMAVVFMPNMSFAAVAEEGSTPEMVAESIAAEGEEESRGEAPTIEAESLDTTRLINVEERDIFVSSTQIGSGGTLKASALSTQMEAGQSVYMVIPDWSKINNPSSSYYDVDPYAGDNTVIPVKAFNYGESLSCTNGQAGSKISISKISGYKYSVADRGADRGVYTFRYLDDDYGFNYSLKIKITGEEGWTADKKLVVYDSFDYTDGSVAFGDIRHDINSLAGEEQTVSLGLASYDWDEEFYDYEENYDTPVPVTPFTGDISCNDDNAQIEVVRNGSEYTFAVSGGCPSGAYRFDAFSGGERYYITVDVERMETGTNLPHAYVGDVVAHALKKGKAVDITSGGKSRKIYGNIEEATTELPVYSDWGVYKYKVENRSNFNFTVAAPGSGKDIELFALYEFEGDYTIVDYDRSEYSSGEKTVRVSASASAGEYIYIAARFTDDNTVSGLFSADITVKGEASSSNEIAGAIANLYCNGELISQNIVRFSFDEDEDVYVGDSQFPYGAYAYLEADPSSLSVSLEYYDAAGLRDSVDVVKSGDSSGVCNFNSREDGTGLDYRYEYLIEKEGDAFFNGSFERSGYSKEFTDSDFNGDRELTLTYKHGQGGYEYDLNIYAAGSGAVLDPRDEENEDFEMSVVPSRTPSVSFKVIPAGCYVPVTYNIKFEEDPDLGLKSGQIAFTGNGKAAMEDLKESRAVKAPYWADSAKLSFQPESTGTVATVTFGGETITKTGDGYNLILPEGDAEAEGSIVLEKNGKSEVVRFTLKKTNGSVAKIEKGSWELKKGSTVKESGGLSFKSGSGTKADPYIAKVKVADNALSTSSNVLRYSLAAAEWGEVERGGTRLGNKGEVTLKKSGASIKDASKTDEFKVISADGTSTAYYKVLFIKTSSAKISSASVTGLNSLGYTGEQLTHDSLKVSAGGFVLTEGRDYTLTYSNNVNVSTSAKVTVKGLGFFTGSLTKTFEITKGEQAPLRAELEVSPQSPADPDVLYVGKNKGTITAGPESLEQVENIGNITATSSKTKIATVTEKEEGVFEVTPKAAGTVTITLKAAGNANYKAETKTFTIKVVKPTQITSSMIYISPSAVKYDGSEQRPAVTVKTSSKAKPLREGIDYTVEYANNVDVGTAKVMVSAAEDNYAYGGLNVTKTFKITKGSQSRVSADIEYSSQNAASPETLYVGKNTVTLTPGEERIDCEGDVLIAENVGTITATSSSKKIATVSKQSDGSFLVTPKAAGTVSITLKAAGDENFNSVSTKYIFKVVKPKQITSSMIKVAPSTYTYDGTEKEPDVTVKLSSKAAPLVEGEDYTVDFSDNVNAGKAAVYVTANPDNYALGGTNVKKTFTIKKNAQTLDAAIEKDAIYLGTEANARTITVAPSDEEAFVNVGTITAKSSSTKIATVMKTSDNTWTVTGKSAGVAKVTLTAGATTNLNSVSKTFTVYVAKPQAITAKMITVSGDSSYRGGDEVTPAVTIKAPVKSGSSSKITLTGDATSIEPDYSVSYENNTEVGKGVVVITAVGPGFTNEEPVRKEFAITPAAMAVPNVTATPTGIHVQWDEVDGNTKDYQVRYSTKSSMSRATTKTFADVTSCDIKLKGKTYYVQVRARQYGSDASDTTVYIGPWSQAVMVKR